MIPESVLRILRRLNDHPAGLTAAYDALTDRINIEWRDFPFSPSTGLLRASEADDEAVAATVRRFMSA